MRALTVKTLISLAAVALVAPFFALALVVGARAVSLMHGPQENLLLIALACAGAALSVLNGFGRRSESRAQKNAESREGHYGPSARKASALYPGY
jgi:hypothetical protein